MDERRCDVISMVEASDCRGGVAVSICSLEAVAAETGTLMSKSPTKALLTIMSDHVILLQGSVVLLAVSLPPL